MKLYLPPVIYVFGACVNGLSTPSDTCCPVLRLPRKEVGYRGVGPREAIIDKSRLPLSFSRSIRLPSQYPVFPQDFNPPECVGSVQHSLRATRQPPSKPTTQRHLSGALTPPGFLWFIRAPARDPWKCRGRGGTSQAIVTNGARHTYERGKIQGQKV